MTPHLYIGTIGLSVWHSQDRGETLRRLLSDSGLYSEARVWAFSSHPSSPNELMAGTDAGIYRLDREKNRWTHMPSQLDGLCVWSIAQSPFDPNLILAGTRPARLYRSVDGGANWEQLDVPFPTTCAYVVHPRVTKILFDQKDPNLVWASLEIGGVWRSTDAGAHWSNASSGLVSDDVHGLSVVYNGGRVLFATTNEGLHCSQDDGQNWSLRMLPDAPWQYTRTIVPRADGGGCMFLTNGDGPPGSTGRLLRSRDWGEHWEDAGLPGEIRSTPWCIATHPVDPQLIFVSTCLGQYFRSEDGGESWSPLPRQLSETRALSWLPD